MYDKDDISKILFACVIDSVIIQGVLSSISKYHLKIGPIAFNIFENYHLENYIMEFFSNNSITIENILYEANDGKA